MIQAPSGTGFNSVLNAHRPVFVWDALRAGRAIGGVAGGRVDCTVEDLDAISPAHSFSVWSNGAERFEVVDGATQLEEVLGSVGDFSDGTITNYWSGSWALTNLGLSVTAPTTAAMLGQVTGVPADIISGGSLLPAEVTFVDTSEVQDSVVERSCSLSATYSRVFQILVKSEDGHSPDTRVSVGANSAAGTRTTVPASTWYRELPGSKGWYAVLFLAPNNVVTTNYLTMAFAQGTGRWLVSAPMWYNQYSTFENIVRAPIPRAGVSQSRGQYRVYTTNSEFSIPVAGWLAGSLVLPDRGLASGHLDYSGASAYGTMGLFSWISGTYRIRIFMSTTYDRLILQMDNGGVSFAYLDFPSDWADFEPMGFVVTWGLTSGSEYATLYVNGNKEDSVFGTADWYPQTLPASVIHIGSDGVTSTAAADCWISRVAMGRRPMHRVQARMLSSVMLQAARGGR